MIQEGKAKVNISLGEKITRKLDVFYNPSMQSHRDISVLFLSCYGLKKIKIADPLAGSGIRSLRFLLELPASVIEEIYVNDGKKDFVTRFKKQLQLNKLSSKKIHVSAMDANKFLLENKSFHYIDIDPFGSPNPFLDVSIQCLAHAGVLAVTATDTSALCGSYPKACLRKYWAEPLHNHLMHETGLRILIRKVQLIGAQYEKALIPVFSYAEKHYMRVYFRCERSRSGVDKVLGQHGLFQEKGPMWLGLLWDKRLVGKMLKKCSPENKEVYALLSVINDECKIDTLGFYDTHVLGKQLKLGNLPKKQDLIDWINKKWKASSTHFCGSAIRSTIPEKDLIKKIKEKKRKKIK